MRSESTLTDSSGDQTCLKNNRTSVQCDVNTTRGQLTSSEQYSDATLFDSVWLRGVRVTFDDAMLPNSERGYAPVMCGQVTTNAVIEVH